MKTNLSVSNISKIYPGCVANDKVTLEFVSGKIYALLGENGAGKSTLVKILSGVIIPDEGEIFLNKNISYNRPNERSILGIGYVPQGRDIFNTLNVEENISLPAISRKIINLKDELEKIYSIFPILKEKRKDLGGSLSGGQQQQLAIARSLIFSPKIVLLDEPSEGIQPSIVSSIADKLQEISSTLKTAFIVIEQNISFISKLNCDCLIIDKGIVSSKISSPDFSDLDKARKALSLEL